MARARTVTTTSRLAVFAFIYVVAARGKSNQICLYAPLNRGPDSNHEVCQERGVYSSGFHGSCRIKGGGFFRESTVGQYFMWAMSEVKYLGDRKQFTHHATKTRREFCVVIRFAVLDQVMVCGYLP
ncbi:hypothetical protein FPV67DRAFT_1447149 [Lyophyllum atratum]|nr:hypothetical protein FPV67DRAFT_1447149 [Lyophyllum atratum]